MSRRAAFGISAFIFLVAAGLILSEIVSPGIGYWPFGVIMIAAWLIAFGSWRGKQ